MKSSSLKKSKINGGKTKLPEKTFPKKGDRLRAIFSAAMDAKIILDSEGKVVFCNHAAEKIFGFSSDEILCKDLCSFVIQEKYRKDYNDGLSEFRKLTEKSVLDKVIKLQGLKKNGEKFSMELSLSPLKLENQLYALGFVRDVSKLNSAEEELNKYNLYLENQVKDRTAELTEAKDKLLQEISKRKKAEEKQMHLLLDCANANQDLKNFANIVIHDLKAPLRGIKLIADVISTDYSEKLGKEGKKQMDILKGRVKRMYNLIEGIYRYSKYGSFKGEKVEANLNVIVSELIDKIVPPENIDTIIENELPTIFFEKNSICQIFQNLLSNAVNSINIPKGEIRIGCIAEGSNWKFYVADNGKGIEEKHFTTIFKLFQTISSKEDYESVGIGLSLVKKIVENNRGKIWLESEVGRGSTFYFLLPKGVK